MPETYIPHIPGTKITVAGTDIKVEGHTGTWYVIDSDPNSFLKPAFLLEHETWGDEAAAVIVDEDGCVPMDDGWNGFSDLYEAFGIEAPARK